MFPQLLMEQFQCYVLSIIAWYIQNVIEKQTSASDRIWWVAKQSGWKVGKSHEGHQEVSPHLGNGLWPEWVGQEKAEKIFTPIWMNITHIQKAAPPSTPEKTYTQHKWPLFSESLPFALNFLSLCFLWICVLQNCSLLQSSPLAFLFLVSTAWVCDWFFFHQKIQSSPISPIFRPLAFRDALETGVLDRFLIATAEAYPFWFEIICEVYC